MMASLSRTQSIRESWRKRTTLPRVEGTSTDQPQTPRRKSDTGWDDPISSPWKTDASSDRSLSRRKSFNIGEGQSVSITRRRSDLSDRGSDRFGSLRRKSDLGSELSGSSFGREPDISSYLSRSSRRKSDLGLDLPGSLRRKSDLSPDQLGSPRRKSDLNEDQSEDQTGLSRQKQDVGLENIGYRWKLDMERRNSPIKDETPGREYVGFATLPDQVHRKSVKKGFEFTLMVVGESGLGKSTLVNSLFLTDLYKDRPDLTTEERISQTVEIQQSTVDIEEHGVRLKLTVVDTPGFGDSVNSINCWEPIIEYIQEQFIHYYDDESGLNRKNITDKRVHCCLYFVSPYGHGLRPIDIEFMKRLHDKVNIVPIIAKADCLTPSEVKRLKRRVLSEISDHDIHIYSFPDCDSDEDEDFKQADKELKESVPFAVIGSNTVVEVNGKRVRGRLYPWGITEVENPRHCDFVKLRNMLIRTHMQDLKDVTRDIHYENYRLQRIQSDQDAGITTTPTNQPPASNLNRESMIEEVVEKDRMLEEKDAELKKMQQMLAKMQEEMAKAQQTQEALSRAGSVKSSSGSHDSGDHGNKSSTGRHDSSSHGNKSSSGSHDSGDHGNKSSTGRQDSGSHGSKGLAGNDHKPLEERRSSAVEV